MAGGQPWRSEFSPPSIRARTARRSCRSWPRWRVTPARRCACCACCRSPPRSSVITAEGLADLQHAEAELAGGPVEAVVRFGEPAAEIVVEAEAFHADLIALAAGRSGRLRSALAPGVADRVARTSGIPTLTLRG